MLYTRSSFIKWLTDVKDCEIINLDDRKGRVITVKNGPCTAYIFDDKRDQIDYEEIYIVCCKKLWMEMPGDKDLIRLE
ncbi:MAG TPA: hypothetical protein VMU83_11300 [Hanamia sp.]|nr:hypothetical protein [Hanamia sp.]